MGPELTDRCSELRRFSFAFITFFRPESTPQLSFRPDFIDDGLLPPLPTSDGDRRDSIRPSLRVGVRFGGGGCGPVRLRSTPSAKEARRRRSAVSIFLRAASDEEEDGPGAVEEDGPESFCLRRRAEGP